MKIPKIPKGFTLYFYAIPDHSGIKALVCVYQRMFILNTAAREDARITQLYFGEYTPKQARLTPIAAKPLTVL